MKKTAVITGGQQGIGLAAAQSLSALGYQLAIISLPKEDDPMVTAMLNDFGGMARYYHHDMQNIKQVPALIDRIEADFGDITTVISNAGVASPLRGDMLDLSLENFDFVMNVNLRGGFFLVQEIAKRMCAKPHPFYRSISFITSVSAQMVSIERAEYCISKSAASMMASLFAVRLAAENIGVFELRPGIIATDMTAGVKEKYDNRIANGLVPAQKWGMPKDIGQVIEAIAEGKLAFSNGAIIPIDGGLSIARL